MITKLRLVFLNRAIARQERFYFAYVDSNDTHRGLYDKEVLEEEQKLNALLAKREAITSSAVQPMSLVSLIIKNQ